MYQIYHIVIPLITTKLKTIRCDNAKEFTSGIFRQKLKDLGIELQTVVSERDQ